MGHPISLPSKEVKSTEHIGKAESERSHFNTELQDPRDMAKAELLEIQFRGVRKKAHRYSG
jgi:hypothetical protein